MRGPSRTTTPPATGSPRPGLNRSASMRSMGASPYQPARNVDTPPGRAERVERGGRVGAAVRGGGGQHAVPGGTVGPRVGHPEAGHADDGEQRGPGYRRSCRVEPEPTRLTG